MEDDWRAAASFERTHVILSAVNTLLIHAKLILAGVPDPTPGAEIQKARGTLTSLLNRLGSLVEATGQRKNSAVVGADPQLAELARWFIRKQRQGGSQP